MDNCLSWNCFVEIGRNIFSYPAGSDTCQEAGGYFPYPKTIGASSYLTGKFGTLWVGLTTDENEG